MEKNEKKKISCSYALLVVVLFAVVCFLVDYIVIDRKLNENKGGCSTSTNVSENGGNNSNASNVSYEIITNEELEALITDEIDFLGTTRLSILNRVNSIDEITNQQKLSYALKLLFLEKNYINDLHNKNYLETFSGIELENVFRNSILGDLTLNNEDILAVGGILEDGNLGFGYTYHDGIYDNLYLMQRDIDSGMNYLSYKILSITSNDGIYKMSVKYLWGIFSELHNINRLYSNINDVNSVLTDIPTDVIKTRDEAKKWASDNFEIYENKLSTYNYTFVKENGIIKLVDFSIE